MNFIQEIKGEKSKFIKPSCTHSSILQSLLKFFHEIVTGNYVRDFLSVVSFEGVELFTTLYRNEKRWEEISKSWWIALIERASSWLHHVDYQRPWALTLLNSIRFLRRLFNYIFFVCLLYINTLATPLQIPSSNFWSVRLCNRSFLFYVIIKVKSIFFLFGYVIIIPTRSQGGKHGNWNTNLEISNAMKFLKKPVSRSYMISKDVRSSLKPGCIHHLLPEHLSQFLHTPTHSFCNRGLCHPLKCTPYLYNLTPPSHPHNHFLELPKHSWFSYELSL